MWKSSLQLNGSAKSLLHRDSSKEHSEKCPTNIQNVPTNSSLLRWSSDSPLIVHCDMHSLGVNRNNYFFEATKLDDNKEERAIVHNGSPLSWPPIGRSSSC